jgi:hypothetical protein
MRAIADSILFLAAAVALAGSWIAEALGKSTYGFDSLGMAAGLVMGGLGMAVLLSDYASGRSGKSGSE